MARTTSFVGKMVIGIVLMVVGGLLLFVSSSWIGYIGGVLAAIGAVTVLFTIFRS